MQNSAYSLQGCSYTKYQNAGIIHLAEASSDQLILCCMTDGCMQGWGGRSWCGTASTACKAGGATSCALAASCASSTWRTATAPTLSSTWAAMTARQAPSDRAFHSLELLRLHCT